MFCDVMMCVYAECACCLFRTQVAVKLLEALCVHYLLAFELFFSNCVFRNLSLLADFLIPFCGCNPNLSFVKKAHLAAEKIRRMQSQIQSNPLIG